MGNKNVLTVVVIAIVAFLLLAFRKGNGDGEGGVTIGGTIGEVMVSQGSGRLALAQAGHSGFNLHHVPMGSHLAPKTQGSTLHVSIVFNPSTKNSAGQKIFWPYFFDYTITSRATGAIVETAGYGRVEGGSNPVTWLQHHGMQSFAPGDYDYSLGMYAAKSQSDGTPHPTDIQFLQQHNHPSAFRVT